MFDVQRSMLKVEPLTSNLELRTSNLESRTFNVERFTSTQSS